METVFDGIPLNKITTSMTINSTAAILLGIICSGLALSDRTSSWGGIPAAG
jgi:methylmalonyl-CoA mutase N-terminal domain/subunit